MRSWLCGAVSLVLVSLCTLKAGPLAAEQPAQVDPKSSSSTLYKHTKKPAPLEGAALDLGSVGDGVYRNKALGVACKIPAGWVLRTEEMNAREDETAAPDSRTPLDRTAEGGCPHTGGCGRVLLGAFSRPPEATAEDVNSSILIAAESAALYPGLKDAAQYFGPVTEVAKAQGFEVVNEPYEFTVGANANAAGTKTLVRADFQRNIGTRVMRQSTLVLLARGYAVSFTFIGGTAEEVEELVAGLSFAAPAPAVHK
jgi:hypothetical protein